MYPDGEKGMTFKEGDKVSWTSKSGGVLRRRAGVVVKVVPPLKIVTTSDLETELKEFQTYGVRKQLSHSSGLRVEESYIVAVAQNESKPKIFWPHEYQLKQHTEVSSANTKTRAGKRTKEVQSSSPGLGEIRESGC